MSGEIAPRKIGRGSERNLDVGPSQPMVHSFDLHLRAEKKSPKTIRTYLEAAQWFAAEYLIPAGLSDWSDVKRGMSRSGRLPFWAGTPTLMPATSAAIQGAVEGWRGQVANQRPKDREATRPRHRTWAAPSGTSEVS
jgi:hypothetical protein